MYVHAKPLQPCPTLCDPVDCSLPGFSVHGDSPGKNAAVSCSRRSSSRGSFPPRVKPSSLLFPALAGSFFIASVTWKAHVSFICSFLFFYLFIFLLSLVMWFMFFISSYSPVIWEAYATFIFDSGYHKVLSRHLSFSKPGRQFVGKITS